MMSRRFVFLVLLGCLVLSVPAFAEGTTQPGVTEPGHDQDPSTGTTDMCWICTIVQYENGETMTGCSKPYSGGWGNKRCEVEAYPEGVYCYTYDDVCCVN